MLRIFSRAATVFGEEEYKRQFDVEDNQNLFLSKKSSNKSTVELMGDDGSGSLCSASSVMEDYNYKSIIKKWIDLDE